MADTVLLVDYDPRNIAKTRSWLQNAGLEVRLARDGEAAIHAFRAWRPDLVVLQDLLPKLHGFEVCRAIKAIAADAPVVLIAHAPRGRRYAVLDTGCDAFVQKPVRESDLLDAIRAHVALCDDTPVPVAAPPVPPPTRRPAFVLPARLEEQDIDATLDVLFDFDGGSREAAGPPPPDAAANATGPRREPASRTKATKKRVAKKKTAKKKAARKKTTRKTGPAAAGAKGAKKKTARKSSRKAAAKSTRSAAATSAG